MTTEQDERLKELEAKVALLQLGFLEQMKLITQVVEMLETLAGSKLN